MTSTDAGDGVPPEIYQDATVVLELALSGDREGVTGAVDAVVHRGGVRGAYDLACSLAAVLVGDAPAAGFATRSSLRSKRPGMTPAGWPGSSPRT